MSLETQTKKSAVEPAELKKMSTWWKGILDQPPVVEYHYLTTKTAPDNFKQQVIDGYMKENHFKKLQQHYPRSQIVLNEHQFADPLDLYFKLQKIQKNKENAQHICINLSAAKPRDLITYQKDIFENVPPSMLREKTLKAICPDKESANKLSTDFFKFDYA
jgi:hypothetical protein